ncbi:Sla2p [Ascoidea rubescens DSM 1968]|uniref:ANTH-domain-containing protein n=1 Tax=Ascoidea rubescens DSM 1968 TaxID=1344418 RepID=A0A1D2VG93_9ASCO|nr:ANTH-domain-containing protein [Ascoidea rubescens DSM 1968]ODV60619.1 ANTH-domain-containing protein [Ascoidea rubescens DSM 1968]
MSSIFNSVKKATSLEESAPKRKHVRNCIVYSWDHKDSKVFWDDLRRLPILNDEVQSFKALILIHKLLQEGHPVCLRDALRNINWIDSVGKIYGNTGDGIKGYGRLLREYVVFLLKKLNFHKMYKSFNGVFEYEDYISLQTVSDPNEGYEAILELMNLQDSIDDFQKLIFASISDNKRSECKISALVPLLTESYGIYKFVTSMLRALYKSSDSYEALQPLKARYAQQHSRLYEFYADCMAIRYLSSIVTVPKLKFDPPSIAEPNNDSSLNLPPIREKTPSPTVSSTPQPPSPEPQNSIFDAQKSRGFDDGADDNDIFPNVQSNFASIFTAPEPIQIQPIQPIQTVQPVIDQQQQYQLVASQQRIIDLESQLFSIQQRFQADQLMLQQYDSKVKDLESQLQLASDYSSKTNNDNSQLIANMNNQLSIWKKKYDSLAKLYSELREEHLKLLSQFKILQKKAASAQEIINKSNKLEKDLAAKNIELANLIKQRDAARVELSRVKNDNNNTRNNPTILSLDNEVNSLKEQLIEESDRSNQYLIEIHNYKDQIDALQNKLNSIDEQSLKSRLLEKEDDVLILQQSVDDTLNKLAELQDEHEIQLIAMVDEQLHKVGDIIDIVLSTAIENIRNEIFELDSPTPAKQISTPSYALSVLEKSSSSLNDFTTLFNDFLIDGANGDPSAIVISIYDFFNSISTVISTGKSIITLTNEKDLGQNLFDDYKYVGQVVIDFLESVKLSELRLLETEEDKADKVIDGNFSVNKAIKDLEDSLDKLTPKLKMPENLDELVDQKINDAVNSVIEGSKFLNKIIENPDKLKVSSVDIQVSKAILSSTIFLTDAISALLQAAARCQDEIASSGKYKSRNEFYKKNNKWTQGLISAANSVATSTSYLIKTADGLINNSNSFEELIVASNGVVSSTVQLVASSKVRIAQMSKSQDDLEQAGTKVNSASKALVNKVKSLLGSQEPKDNVDYSKFSGHQLKTTEMEQQIEILKLENALDNARKKLGQIRIYSYHDDSDEE